MRRHILDNPISYVSVFMLARCLPTSVCRHVGRRLALLVYAASPKDRRGMAYNLSLALGLEPRHPRIRRICRRLFMNYGQYMADYFLLPQLPPAKAMQSFAYLNGERIIQNVLAAGRGAILLSAHIGNWEFGGLMMRLSRYPLTVVAQPHNTAVTNALVNRFRIKQGIRVVEMTASPFASLEILSCLRQNGVVAMIGDRDLYGNGVQVDFFGRNVCFPAGPCALAMASGAPLIPAFVLKQADGRYFGVLESPIWVRREGSRHQTIRKGLQKVARVFENYIRRYPDQWYCPDPITGEGVP